MHRLWHFGHKGKKVPREELAADLLTCIEDGDGVADHYGGRTSFTFLAQRNDEILVLERLEDKTIQAFTALNLTGGYGTGILGEAVKHLSETLQTILQDATTTTDEFHSIERFRLVERMKRLIAEHTQTSISDWEITFTSTGSEAVDFALQLVNLDGFELATGRDARKERDVIVACHGAWHGWSFGPNQMLDRRQFTDGLPRLASREIVFMRFGDIEHLQEVFSQYKGRLRAIIVEGILGDGGIVNAETEWWDRLLELATNNDVRVIDDEILTGLRTGAALALPAGRAPDCFTLGKALGFGLFPISAVAWRTHTLSARPGLGVRTFNARPFQAAIVDAGLALIERENLFVRSRQLGSEFLSDLAPLVAKYPLIFKSVRGYGFFIGLELSDTLARKGRQLRDELLRHGVLVEVESGLFSRKIPRPGRVNETLRLTPPLTISGTSLRLAAQRIEKCALSLNQQMDADQRQTRTGAI